MLEAYPAIAEPFNTLPRVETAETKPPSRAWPVDETAFQYPTTGRDC